METITGTNNWKLTIRRGAEGVTILRAATCDTRAMLPDTLFGLPVTALGDHALAPGAKPTEDETVMIVGAPCGSDYDNAALRDLTLPADLNAVGDYALMNCRALQRLRLCDRVIDWGAGALMNCRALDTLALIRDDGTDNGTLAYFAGELAGELDVSIIVNGEQMVRCIFPEYIEEFEENGPAHHFDYKVYGAGQPYHRAFRDRKLNLYDYDALWPSFLAGAHDADTALRLAWWRAYYPEALTSEAAARYWGYLTTHAEAALRFLLGEHDTALLRFFLTRVDCNAETLCVASELARRNRDTAATALLLEELHRKSGAQKTFDL